MGTSSRASQSVAPGPLTICPDAQRALTADRQLLCPAALCSALAALATAGAHSSCPWPLCPWVLIPVLNSCTPQPHLVLSSCSPDSSRRASLSSCRPPSWLNCLRPIKASSLATSLSNSRCSNTWRAGCGSVTAQRRVSLGGERRHSAVQDQPWGEGKAGPALGGREGTAQRRVSSGGEGRGQRSVGCPVGKSVSYSEEHE